MKMCRSALRCNGGKKKGRAAPGQGIRKAGHPWHLSAYAWGLLVVSISDLSYAMPEISRRPPIKLMFVCLGNICRSPLAEGVFRHLAEEAGVADQFIVDSSGTGRWHVGQPPDARMCDTARRHGIRLDDQRGRQIEANDLSYYDYIFAMDGRNLHTTRALDTRKGLMEKVQLFRDFDPEPDDYNVPDPYYGEGLEGFEEVYHIVERTARHLLDHLIGKHDLVPTNTARSA